MLSSQYRLPRQDISPLLRFGKRIRGDVVELVFRPQSSAFSSKGSRFAFIVSTKIAKKATDRNRIRRILSESVGLILKTLDLRVREDDNVGAMDIIFVVRKNIADMSQVEVEPMVRALLVKVGIVVS